MWPNCSKSSVVFILAFSSRWDIFFGQSSRKGTFFFETCIDIKINFVHSKLFLLASPTNEKFNVTGVQFTHCFLRLDFCLNYLIRGSLKIRDKMRARITKYKQKINKLCACQRRPMVSFYWKVPFPIDWHKIQLIIYNHFNCTYCKALRTLE